MGVQRQTHRSLNTDHLGVKSVYAEAIFMYYKGNE